MSEQCTINYVEFATSDNDATKAFFETAFGWRFEDYGDTYSAFVKDGPNGTALDGGIDKRPEAKPGPALVVLHAADLEAAQAAVEAAGAEIVCEAFAFPGGRRFHFREPGGTEMAIWA
jgi:predicted enzyme related to lactoylglutathione lyase